MSKAIRLVLLAWIGLAGLGLEARAQGTISAPGGVGAGRDIRDSTINIGISDKVLEELVRDRTKPLQDLADTRKDTIDLLKDKLQLNERQIRAALNAAGEADVAPERIGEKLVEIAKNYQQALAQAAAAPGDDPEVAKLKSEVKAALDAGELERADDLLAQEQAAQDAALERRQLDAAATAAQRGEIALTRLRYRDAAEHFAAAARRVPPGHEEQSSDYLDREAHTLVSSDDYTGALAASRTALQIRKDLHLRDPSNVTWSIKLVFSHNTIGQIFFFFQKYDEALTEYDSSKRILETLEAQDSTVQYSTKSNVQSKLADNLRMVGIIKGRQGDHVAELDALRAARIIWERLSAVEPHNPDLTVHIMDNYNAIGDALRARGDMDGALAAYGHVQSMEHSLTSESTSGEVQISSVKHLVQATVVKSYNGVGEVLRARRDFTGALNAYHTAEAIAEPLADKGQDKSLWQSFLDVSYLGITHVYLDQGDYVRALESERNLKLIHEDLAAQDPSNVYRQSRLALDDKLIGALLWKHGDQPGALEAFRQWVALLRRTVEVYNNPSELAEALGHLSWYYLLTGQFAEAKTAAEEGCSLDNQQIWILLSLANAQMFLGHTDVATDIHKRYKDALVLIDGHERRWRDIALEQFADLRKAGFDVSAMTGLEHLLQAH